MSKVSSFLQKHMKPIFSFAMMMEMSKRHTLIFWITLKERPSLRPTSSEMKKET